MLVNQRFNVIYFFLILFSSVCLSAFTASAEDIKASHFSYGVSIFEDLKYPENFSHFDYVNPEAPKSGKVKTAAIGSFDNLHPFAIKGTPPESVNLIFDTLMAASADEKQSSYPLVAEKVEISENKDWAVFYINPAARWNDGTEITSDDVVFSLEALKTKSHPFYQVYYMDIEKAEKLDKYKVKFYFSNKNNRELIFIASQLPVLSKAYFADKDFSKSLLEAPLSSGPYVIKKFKLGHSVTYKRNKDYWARNLPVNIGRYNFNTIKLDYYRDASIAVEAFKAGEYDFRRENISKIWAKSYNISEVKEGKIIKEKFPDNSPQGMQCFVFNIRRSPFNNIMFRKALNYAYDFEWSNKNLFYSAYFRNKSYFGISEFASDGLPDNDELKLLNPFKDILPQEVFTQEYKLPVNKRGSDIRNNLIKARDLLKQAGFFLRDMKLIDPETNSPVEIEFLLVSPFFERVIAPYIKNLNKLGIEATIRTVSYSQYINFREDFNYDIIVNWFLQKPFPGNEQFDYWYSSKADQTGSRNYAGVKHKAVDAMVNKILSAENKKDLVAASRALDRILLWNFYVVPQWNLPFSRLIYRNKFAKPEIIPEYSLSILDTWWLK